MKHIALLATLAMLTLAACNKEPPEKPFVPDPVIPSSGTLPPGHPPVNSEEQNTTPSEGSDDKQTQKGTVVSTIDIPQFTYIEVKQNDQVRWLAASTIATKKGDTIEFDHGETVRNFRSKTLMRTFPSITFVNHASVVKDK
jgi:hypothetical protein